MNYQELRKYFQDNGFNPDEMFRQMRIAELNEQREKSKNTLKNEQTKTTPKNS